MPDAQRIASMAEQATLEAMLERLVKVDNMLKEPTEEESDDGE